MLYAQCFRMDAWCDGFLDCTHGDDEIGCGDSKDFYINRVIKKFKYLYAKSRELKYNSPEVVSLLDNSDVKFKSETYAIRRPLSPPAVVEFTAQGSHKTTRFTRDKKCPQTHFQCPGGYCLPVFVLCNDINDCPGWEDEVGCDTYTCPGLYRCRGSRVCLHEQHLCDQVFQCPRHDDEVLCNTSCPQQCVCSGLSYFCSRVFHAGRFSNVRYIDARGTGMSLDDFVGNHLLIHLSLAQCLLSQVQDVYLPNLHSLDLSDNKLDVIDAGRFQSLVNLRVLFLSNNPLRSQLFTNLPTDTSLPPLQTLDLSGAALGEVDLNLFHLFMTLEVINLSFCGLDTFTGSGFPSKIRSVDIRKNPLTSFPPGFLRDAASLQKVWTDSYRVCCPQVLPEGFSLIHCQSPSDAVSSCHSLLKLAVYRVSSVVHACLAVLGSVVNFVIHVVRKKGFTRQSHGVFFVHLCLSQAVMGMYQVIIVAADLAYRGHYVWQDVRWKESAACHLAGLLYLLSTQTSMFLVCLLMLDPLLQLFFPSSQRHFTVRSARAVCVMTWLCSLSVCCSLLVTSRQGQTALCLPLLLAERQGAGHGVVFGVTVVNWVLLAWQAVSQGALFHVIQTQPLAFVTAVSACGHMDTARRYSGVARLHLLCWLPLGVVVVLTSRGMTLPGQLETILTLVMLPISPSFCSAVYYISVLRQTQRHTQRQRLLQRAEWKNVAVAAEEPR